MAGGDLAFAGTVPAMVVRKEGASSDSMAAVAMMGMRNVMKAGEENVCFGGNLGMWDPACWYGSWMFDLSVFYWFREEWGGSLNRLVGDHG